MSAFGLGKCCKLFWFVRWKAKRTVDFASFTVISRHIHWISYFNCLNLVPKQTEESSQTFFARLRKRQHCREQFMDRPLQTTTTCVHAKGLLEAAGVGILHLIKCFSNPQKVLVISTGSCNNTWYYASKNHHLLLVVLAPQKTSTLSGSITQKTSLCYYLTQLWPIGLIVLKINLHKSD